MGQPAYKVEQMRPNSILVYSFLQYLLLGSSSVKSLGKDTHGNNIQKEDDAVTPHPHKQDKNEYVAKICQKREHERKLDLGRQNHDHDENSCSMNAPYNEASVDDLNVTAHKGLRRRLVMAIETIQRSSDTNVATSYRKTQDETRNSVQTSSSKNTLNGI